MKCLSLLSVLSKYDFEVDNYGIILTAKNGFIVVNTSGENSVNIRYKESWPTLGFMTNLTELKNLEHISVSRLSSELEDLGAVKNTIDKNSFKKAVSFYFSLWKCLLFSGVVGMLTIVYLNYLNILNLTLTHFIVSLFSSLIFGFYLSLRSKSFKFLLLCFGSSAVLSITPLIFILFLNLLVLSSVLFLVI